MNINDLKQNDINSINEALRIFDEIDYPDSYAIEELAQKILNSENLDAANRMYLIHVKEKLSDPNFRNKIINPGWAATLVQKVYSIFFQKKSLSDFPDILSENINKRLSAVLKVAPPKLPIEIIGVIAEYTDQNTTLLLSAAQKNEAFREKVLLDRLANNKNPLTLPDIEKILLKNPALWNKVKSIAIFVPKEAITIINPRCRWGRSLNSEISLDAFKNCPNLKHVFLSVYIFDIQTIWFEGKEIEVSIRVQLKVKFPTTECPLISHLSFAGCLAPICENLPDSVKNLAILTPNSINSKHPFYRTSFLLLTSWRNKKMESLSLQSVNVRPYINLESDRVSLVTRSIDILEILDRRVLDDYIKKNWKNTDWEIVGSISSDLFNRFKESLETFISEGTTVRLTYTLSVDGKDETSTIVITKPNP